MRTLLTSIVAILIFTTATASNFEGIKIGTTGKSSIEAKYNSKKATTAIITITNQVGVVTNTINVNLTKGDNTISLVDVTTLEEGTYIISLDTNGTKSSTKFVNFKATEAL
jgi:hypothetical protein